MPRACCADGRAMFTMLASSTTISWATAMTTSASHLRGSTTVWSAVSFVDMTDTSVAGCGGTWMDPTYEVGSSESRRSECDSSDIDRSRGSRYGAHMGTFKADGLVEPDQELAICAEFP